MLVLLLVVILLIQKENPPLEAEEPSDRSDTRLPWLPEAAAAVPEVDRGSTTLRRNGEALRS